MKALDHESLHVHDGLSINFVAQANAVAEQQPYGRNGFADQLHRAYSSVLLNIAEGAGECAPKEKACFCRMRETDRRTATTADTGRNNPHRSQISEMKRL